MEDALAEKLIDYSQVVDAGDFTPRELLVGSRDRYTVGAPLTRSQSMTGFVRSQGLVDDGEGELSLRKYLRGMTLGDWSGADAERRAMAEGTLSAGGYMVPTLLSSQMIDLARNSTRVLRAGATIVPMPNRTLT